MTNDEAKKLYDNGIDAYRAGEYDQALDALTQARDLYNRVGNQAGEAEALNDAGVVCIQMEQWDSAREYLLAALAIRQAQGDHPGEAITQGNLGTMYERAGEYAAAIHAYEQSATLFREIGEKGNEKAVARRLNKLKLKHGRVEEALGDYGAELAAEKELGAPQKMARQLFRLLGRLTGSGAADDEDDDDDWDDESDDEWDDDDWDDEDDEDDDAKD
jgi:tetratricopeptide (TPR) repeat protein